MEERERERRVSCDLTVVFVVYMKVRRELMLYVGR